MKFAAAAVLAAATGAAAWGNVTVTTEVVDTYTTYCPYATQITHGSKTYTVTEATTLTITDCPCTITRAVTATSVVECSTSAAVVVPPVSAVTPPSNATWTTATAYAPPPTGGAPPPTGGAAPPASTPTVVPSSAGKAAVFSGAGLAALVGLAAFVL